MKTWNNADTAMAPDSSHILVIQISWRCFSVIDSKTSFEGHFHCGRLRMASVGTRNEIVPPWTIGRRQPKDV